ncbi:lipoprotein-34 precursor (NlpB) [Aquirhabdus sp.]|uniref:lipoprotein-34 precursor (NlpB) n=1 Tax=Aquirhabdus sp. TaxID=2824160 RepID=UPI00396CBD2A
MLQRGLGLNNKSNRFAKLLAVSGMVAIACAGCSRLSVSNGSMDYKSAHSIPPIQVPAAIQTRQIAPLYPVPAIPENAASEKLVLSNAKGNRFALPKPQPLDPSSIPPDQLGVGAPSAPVLVVDGNGFPILKIEGDAPKIWDVMNRTLSVANVNVANRNTAANRFDVVIDNTTYQLRLGRIGNTTTVTLQKPDDSLADKAIATDLLDKITQNWAG